MMVDPFKSLLGNGLLSGPHIGHTAPHMDIGDMVEVVEDVTVGQYNAMVMLAYGQLATMFNEPSLVEGTPGAFIALLQKSHGGSLDDLQQGLREFVLAMLPDAGLPPHPASALSGITMVLGEMEALLAHRRKGIADEAEAARVQAEHEAQCAAEGHMELQQAWRMSTRDTSERVLVMACMRCGYDEVIEPTP